MEIERKWMPDRQAIPYDLSAFPSEEIDQSYISRSPTIRLRKVTAKGKKEADSGVSEVSNTEYILTVKGALKGYAREELELPLSAEQYERLLKKTEGRMLLKTRYMVPDLGYRLEIDLFHGCYEGRVYVEIEFETEEAAEAFRAPAWFGADVTLDPQYTNAAMAFGNL